MTVKFTYCEKCNTINSVAFDSGLKLPKECKCRAEYYNAEWLSDEEFIKELKNG